MHDACPADMQRPPCSRVADMNTVSGGGIHRLVILAAGSRCGHAFAMTMFSGALPRTAAGQWCRVGLSWDASRPWWAKIEIADEMRGQIVREAFFPDGRPAGKSLLVHVPQAAGQVTLTLFARAGAQAEAPHLTLQVLGRAAAAMRLLGGGWRSLPAALQGSPLGLPGRVRAMLGQGAARRGQAPPYAAWIDLYDTWGERERAALLAATDISIVVAGPGSHPAFDATQASITAQWLPPRSIQVVRRAEDWCVPETKWVVMLCAGERLAPHALACLAVAACADPAAAAFCADIDRCDANGQRSLPGLRPPPDPWLMRSDFFADGAWMFRSPALGEYPADAGQARMALARALPPAQIRRVPLILTHCPPPSALPKNPPPAAWPIGKPWPSISIIVPSACRSRHVLRCLRKVAQATDYPDVEILVAISSHDPNDRRQAEIMRRVAALPRVRLITLDMPDFNFAAVINQAAMQSSGAMLLLLNDDVAPFAPDWLRRLAAFCADEPRADIVGARLLYGNGLVQHAGVIMGLANLCEHAFRLAGRSDPGPQGLARLDRQVIAVTAACLLVRRDLFFSLHGMDERFAIALNDVDFCLRAGEAGARIVFAAGVDMYHFESLSLGRHYSGARAGLEATEVRRLREAWNVRIAADPFYHPCASLELGRAFEPGFPPRQTPLSWIGQEAPARH